MTTEGYLWLLCAFLTAGVVVLAVENTLLRREKDRREKEWMG